MSNKLKAYQSILSDDAYAKVASGYSSAPTYDEGMRGMMKARMATSAHFGNLSAKRMVSPNPKTGMTPKGIGTHYMGSYGSYAVPSLQDLGGDSLVFIPGTPAVNPAEDIRFERDDDAEYFSRNYKDIAPMMKSGKFNSGKAALSMPIAASMKLNSKKIKKKLDDTANKIHK